MTKPADYAALVDQAEKAVHGVKDPELKRIAFQKVLDDLLSGGTAATGATHRKGGRKVARRQTPRTLRVGPRAYIREMIGDGFFKKPKTITDVKVELENRGHHIPLTSLSGPLQQLCQSKELRRQRAGGEGDKKTFSYSNW